MLAIAVDEGWITVKEIADKFNIRESSVREWLYDNSHPTRGQYFSEDKMQGVAELIVQALATRFIIRRDK
jgi:hypothetical protein